MGKHFTHETGELGFRFRGDCGIIHGAATSLSFLFLQVGILPENGGRLPLFLPPSLASLWAAIKKWVNSRLTACGGFWYNTVSKEKKR
jgi:hypothetical protein